MFVVISGLFSYLLFLLLLKLSNVSANSVDSDQTPRSVASDQGLHCLQMSLFWTLGINGLICYHENVGNVFYQEGKDQLKT